MTSPAPHPQSGEVRERARHGRTTRPGSRRAGALHSRLVRLAVLPGLVALAACAAAAVLAARTLPAGVRLGSQGWTMLAGGAAVAVAALLVGGAAAGRTHRTLADRVTELRRGAARGQAELDQLLDRLRRGEPTAFFLPPDERSGDADELELLAEELQRVRRRAEAAVLQAAALGGGSERPADQHAPAQAPVPHPQAGPDRAADAGAAGIQRRRTTAHEVEVFVNLARRLQSLVHREIQLLDGLENEVEDPDLLKGLFQVDHLATRIRRHAENLAVLGGAVSRRQWTRPVTMTEVLRSAIAEVDEYPRVKLVPPIPGTVRGNAVADIIHLLSELVENATTYSPAGSQVLLRAQMVTSGIAVEVEDRGLGLAPDDQEQYNQLLADPERFDIGRLLEDGRIGLYVVASLARRHRVVVRLQTNIYGGVQAVLILPPALMGDAPGEDAREAREPRQVHEARHAPAAQSALPRAEHAPVEHAPVEHASAEPAPPPAPAPAVLPAAETPSERTAELRLPARQSTRPAAPAAPAPAPEPVPGPDPDLDPEPATAGGGARPPLPQRRRQEHLVPQLRTDAPTNRPAPAGPDGEPPEHDPGLMAAFQRGVSRAGAEDEFEPPPAATPAVDGSYEKGSW
ncbi:hypothetical protein BIV57_06360 [Mangrovactinospora gilvigrisea]|uniref:histidine kinase n=1 Tax=Mangrovactinospora gilvigrisea TaxID=1428644 RepID=A0A1J7BHZ0_9ACTN|nr:ATP-binding protein [Mangrovactinospora gilvigrisea]OIV38287.1 hypothetical protein BIV57_06360 [Mangrovactinospora gilvigrisea]